MNIIFLGEGELPKKEIDIEERRSLMDDNSIDKGFYFVLFFFIFNQTIYCFIQPKNSLIKILLVRP